MPGEKSSYDGVVFPAAEISALKELERMLQDTGALAEGESIPILHGDAPARSESAISCYAHDTTVVALSVRSCALTSLPEALGKLTNLQLLDVTGNGLTALPDSLGNLLHLKRLYM